MTTEKTINKCYWCSSEGEDYFIGYIAMSPPIESMELLKETYGGEKWYKWLERDDLTKDDYINMDKLSAYDQMLNTVGKGVLCPDCLRKEDELLKKYNYY